MKDEEFPDIGKKYELSIIGEKIAYILLDESKSKDQKLKSLAECFIEFQDLLEITDEELKEEIDAFCNITVDDLVEAILKYKREN
jgi:hypothetical protein